MNTHPRRGTRALARVAVLAVAAAGLTTLAGPARAATPEGTDAPQRALSNVNGATFTWGLSGYAQKGIFGPWTYKNLSGNVSQLTGSVSNGTQTEYAALPVPATSMPVSSPQKTPNAIRFTAGAGTADPATGAATLTWDGSYTVSAYPAIYGAPDEVYSDPQLTIAANGSGTLTMDLTIGAGQDMAGNPTPAVDLGRLPVMTYSAGSAVRTADDSFRYTPDYLGNTVTLTTEDSPQDSTCTPAGGGTGWWGAWPDAFVAAVPASIRPHFYSTGCGGLQDNKPALPVDVTFDQSGTVAVSDTTLLPNGTQVVTVTGSGFDPELAIGARPPFQGKPAGVYVAFGRYQNVWRPTQGAPSSSRVNPTGANGTGVAVKWAVPAASFAGSGQDPTNAAYTELKTDGTFSTTVSVDQSWITATTGNFGIYTYAGGGATVASYETYTPLTFAKAVPAAALSAADPTYGTAGTATVDLTGDSVPTGDVALSVDGVPSGTATLATGSATFTLPADLARGAHTLAVSYPGDVNTEAASATKTITVGGLTSSAAITAPGTTYGTAGTATVSVASAGPTGGTVVLALDGATVGTQPVTGATTTFALPADLAVGRHALSATYSGDAGTEPSTATGTITVAALASSLAITAPTRTFGQAVTASVTVSGPGSSTGSVTLSRAGRPVGTADLVDGTATFALGRLAAGRFPLTATFSGNATTATSTGTATLKIARATSKTKAVVTRKPTTRKAGTVKVTVSSPTTTPTGKVRVKVKNATGKVVRTVTVALRNGVVTTVLPQGATGRYSVVVTYAATANLTTSTKTTTYQVV